MLLSSTVLSVSSSYDRVEVRHLKLYRAIRPQLGHYKTNKTTLSMIFSLFPPVIGLFLSNEKVQ